jgi:sigma-B regulation protein RsbU (phosphoserine phosphatase)
MPYKKLETTLRVGDILLLYSDGVTEALNEKEEFFLEERLAEVMSQFVLEKNSDNVANYLRNKIAEFVGSHPQSDDITIVALLVNK